MEVASILGYHDRARVELEGLIDDLEREAATIRVTLDELEGQRVRLAEALALFIGATSNGELSLARKQAREPDVPRAAPPLDFRARAKANAERAPLDGSGRQRKSDSTRDLRAAVATVGRPGPRIRRPHATQEERVRRMADLVKTIQDAGRPLSMPELCERMSLPRTTLKNDVAVLIEGGQIQTLGGRGATRSYGLTANLDAQVAAGSGSDSARRRHGYILRVEESIRGVGERGITEVELCVRLNMNREDVAFACGALLEEEKVRLLAGGTYRWHTNEEVG